MNNLENIKVGDKVVVEGFGGRNIREVEKITPKGFIKVNDILYRPDGYRRGGDVWSFTTIRPLTPELAKTLEVEGKINKAKKLIQKFNYNRLNEELADKIIELFGEI